jgi:diguanylate cyclase (GGDEF)-like protein
VAETTGSSIDGGLQGVSRDVTELRQLQDELVSQALRDPLTGLANRRLLDELLASTLHRAERNHEIVAVAFLDLDGLKCVNDQHGHDAGDDVLCETARRLVSVAHVADVVARLGGDEFIVVYRPAGVTADALVDAIAAVLDDPIELDSGTIVYCPASIGHVDTTTVGYDADALLAAADEQMYRMKRARTGAVSQRLRAARYSSTA